MFNLQATAETFNYMVFGYSVILGMLFLYILSMVIRFRNLEKDYELLKEVDIEDEEL